MDSRTQKESGDVSQDKELAHLINTASNGNLLDAYQQAKDTFTQDESDQEKYVVDVCHIAPGQKAQNWWPFVRAKHWLIRQIK